MSKRQMVKVDRKRIEEFLKERGLTLGDAAQRMNYSKNYFYNAFTSDNRIALPALRMFEVMFGIPADEVVIRDDAETVGVNSEPATTEVVKESIDYDKLYEVIFRAVHDALTA